LFGCSTNGNADKINKLFVFTPTNHRILLKASRKAQESLFGTISIHQPTIILGSVFIS